MDAVLTGDIVNSKRVPPKEWLEDLKQLLSQYGSNPAQWEVYRGDSFQLLLPHAEALLAAYRIKAAIKRYEQLDVRLAIGLGHLSFEADKVMESNGDAFVRSGESFELLKKRNLIVRSPKPDFDQALNLMLQLFSTTADGWTPATAEVLYQALQNPNASQKTLAATLGRKSQSTISEALKRGGYEALKQLLQWYAAQIQSL